MLRPDQTTLQLFSSFPREVGNPKRRLAYNLYEFNNFIFENDGVAECFTGVYGLDRNIDKIFFDFDGDESLNEAIVIYRYLRDKGYYTIPVASGKKGIHLYILLRPKQYGEQSKDLLYRASISIIKNAFNGGVGKTIDRHIIGDIKRLCRIPNTMRPPENRAWCTYLPPNFDKVMSPVKFAKHIKEPHSYNYDIPNKLPDLHDLIDKNVDMTFNRSYTERNGVTLQVGNGSEFLKRLLRPCIYEVLVTIHPPHDIRVAATIDLINVGLSEESVINAYKTLGWEDFDEDYTAYQIKQISERNYIPYACNRLQHFTQHKPEICKGCMVR